jgi:hypothetical protein
MSVRLAIVSDIHYAGPVEQARGPDYELRGIANPFVRLFVRIHRRFFWMRAPLEQGYLLDRFLQQPGDFDFVIANGDYSCNTAFVGVSDEAAFHSARECLEKLRQKFGPRLRAVFGDHELGKLSFFGAHGGMRLASWRRACGELGLEPFWKLEIENYILIGVVSSLIALTIFRPDTLPEEWDDWQQLRAAHMDEIRSAFSNLRSEQRVLLFCHDPTALPFLLEEDTIGSKLPQIEQTIIGHLHSNLILWKSRVLAGMPKINFLGYTAKRMSTALGNARSWSKFNVRLCPALAGIELLNDGGYLTADLNSKNPTPAHFKFHRIPRER